jgi:hypothetical protein
MTRQRDKSVTHISFGRREDCRHSLGAFAKLRKVTISFVMPVCPSVCKEQFGSNCIYIHDISYLSIFRNSVEKVQVSLKSNKNNEYFT